MQRVVFKPYACGTMIHPYIDCTIRPAQQGIRGEDIVSIVCETGEGLVHRLWEPLAANREPPSGYAAKSSMPFCMARSDEHTSALKSRMRNSYTVFRITQKRIHPRHH